MRDYTGLFKELMVAGNRAFIEQVKAGQAQKKQKLEAQEDCQCNGGDFAYCEACHGE